MRNLELKFRCGDLDAAQDKAVRLGAREAGLLTQTDTFYPAPHARLKLRDFGDGTGELISYRRPNSTEVRGSEYEIGPTREAARLDAVLGVALGRAGIVRKRRRLLLWKHTRIHLDEVDGLGTFVELETVMTEQTDEEGRSELERVVAALELRSEDRVAVAYVDLLNER